MSTDMTIHVTVEMEPHSEDLGGVLLNRPAPHAAGVDLLCRW